MSLTGNEKSHYIHGAWPDQAHLEDKPTKTKEQYLYGNINLPIAQYRTHITQTIKNNPITIITAATGTGKTTQIGQYLLDEGYDKIVITQPRIVAARTVAERVRQELVDIEGDTAAKYVGYRTAHERNDSPENKILLCTDGLQVMRELNGSGVSGNQVIILDEVHEHNTNMSLLIALMKKRVAEDPGFKGVVMSATMDATALANYFATSNGQAAPIIDIPGRPHEIQQLAGTSIAQEATKYYEQGKNILIFVPGKKEISVTISQIKNNLPSDTIILALHGEQTPTEQLRVFETYQKNKIIVATNIAQTSITIPDIDVVIDSGLERTSDIKNDVQGLYLQPISMATKEQRRGRVGRTKPGIYVEADMYSPHPKKTLKTATEYDKPEIFRKRLDSNILKLAAVGIDAYSLDYFHKPDTDAIAAAQKRLIKLGAIATSGQVTKLGTEMATLPVDPNFSKMIIESRKYGDNVHAQMVAIVATQQYGSIRQTGSSSSRHWGEYSAEDKSDLLLDLDLFITCHNMTDEELTGIGLVAKKVRKSLDIFVSLCETEQLSASSLVVPSLTQREDIRHCIVAGADEIFVKQRGRQFKDYRLSRRKLGAASIVSADTAMVVGSPFDLGETGYMQQYIHGATAISTHELLNSNPSRCNLQFTNYFIDKRGHVFAKDEITFDEHLTGDSHIYPAQPGTALKEFLINTLFDGLAKHSLAKFAEINKTIDFLYYLQDRTPQPLGIPGIVNKIKNIIIKTVPETVVNLQQVDAALPTVTANDLIEADIVAQILESAPTQLNIDGKDATVRYSNNNAFVTMPLASYSNLPPHLTELGERDVFIRFGNNGHYQPYATAWQLQFLPSRSERRNKPKVSKFSPLPNNNRYQARAQGAVTASRRILTKNIPLKKVFQKRGK